MGDININLNVGGAGGAGGANAPSGELKNFQKSIKDDSPEKLAEKMGEKGVEPWQMKELLAEFLKKLQNEVKKEEDPQEKKGLEDLLKQLAQGGPDKKEGGNLISQLLQALGVDQDTADKLGDAIEENAGGGGGNTEID